MNRVRKNRPAHLVAFLLLIILTGIQAGCADELGTAARASTTPPGTSNKPPVASTEPAIVSVTTDPDPDQNRGFMRGSKELEAKLKQIVLDNATIKGFLSGHEHSLRFGPQEINKKSYNIEVGALLKDGVNAQTWLQSSQQDSGLIRRYIGVVYIGYGASYFLAFDDAPSTLTKIIVQQLPSGNIPELTTGDMQKALDIGWADPLVQKLLSGKTWAVDSDQIGVIQEGPKLMGITYKIAFDKSYTFDAVLPMPAPYGPRQFQGDGLSMIVNVTFGEMAVTSIMIMPF